MRLSRDHSNDDLDEIIEYYLSRAQWLTDDNRNRFADAFDALEKAGSLAAGKTDLQQQIETQKHQAKRRYDVYRNNLVAKIKEFLNMTPEQITPVYRKEAKNTLKILQRTEVEESEETAQLKQAWEKHYQQVHQTRVLRFQQIMQEAETLAEKHRFAPAMEKLQEADQWSDTRQQRTELEKQKETFEKKRARYVDWWRKDMERLFATLPENISETELENGDRVLRNLAENLSDGIELEILSKRWADYRAYHQTTVALQKVTQEVEHLWNMPSLLLSEYERAVQIVQKAIETLPSARENEFNALLEKAKKRRQKAKNEINALLDKAASGDFQPLLTEMEQLSQQNYEELPSLRWKEERLLFGELMAAEESVHHLKSLAQSYAQQKAESLKNEAWKSLEIDPLQTDRLLEEAQSLPFLSNETRKQIQILRQERVESALEQRKRTLQLLEKAKQTRAQDIEKAWDLIQEASRLMPTLSEVKTERRYMIPWLRVHFNKQIRKIEELLWEQQDVKQALMLVEQLLSHVKNIPEIEDIHQKALKLYKTVSNKENTQ